MRLLQLARAAWEAEGLHIRRLLRARGIQAAYGAGAALFVLMMTLMLHIAGADHFVPPEQQKAIHEGLDDHPRVTLHDYLGLDHGFATELGERRDEEGARLADERTAAFFAEHLG